VINLGDKVKDTLTGYIGICYAKTQFLHGCTRIGIQAEVNQEDNKIPDNRWLDEPQGELLVKGVLKVDEERKTGGAMSGTPTQNETPER